MKRTPAAIGTKGPARAQHPPDTTAASAMSSVMGKNSGAATAAS
jgi:hypothetical protein